MGATLDHLGKLPFTDRNKKDKDKKVNEQEPGSVIECKGKRRHSKKHSVVVVENSPVSAINTTSTGNGTKPALSIKTNGSNGLFTHPNKTGIVHDPAQPAPDLGGSGSSGSGSVENSASGAAVGVVANKGGSTTKSHPHKDKKRHHNNNTTNTHHQDYTTYIHPSPFPTPTSSVFSVSHNPYEDVQFVSPQYNTYASPRTSNASVIYSAASQVSSVMQHPYHDMRGPPGRDPREAAYHMGADPRRAQMSPNQLIIQQHPQGPPPPMGGHYGAHPGVPPQQPMPEPKGMPGPSYQSVSPSHLISSPPHHTTPFYPRLPNPPP